MRSLRGAYQAISLVCLADLRSPASCLLFSQASIQASMITKPVIPCSHVSQSTSTEYGAHEQGVLLIVYADYVSHFRKSDKNCSFCCIVLATNYNQLQQHRSTPRPLGKQRGRNANQQDLQLLRRPSVGKLKTRT